MLQNSVLKYLQCRRVRWRAAFGKRNVGVAGFCWDPSLKSGILYLMRSLRICGAIAELKRSMINSWYCSLACIISTVLFANKNSVKYGMSVPVVSGIEGR